MNVKNVLPSRRRLSFFVIISSLVAVFFLGYYFYFIPTNKSVEHKNAFLILENIQQNIKDENAYLQNAFINILRMPQKKGDTSKTIVQLQEQLDKYKLDAKIFETAGNQNAGASNLTKSTDELFANETLDSTVYLSGVSGDSLFYEPSSTHNRKYKIYVPAKKFFEPLMAYQKGELFNAYMLIGKGTGVVYADDRLAINTGISQDSLIPGNSKSLFPGIRDINMKGGDFKMFYFPFRLGTAQVQLCGFVPSGVYNSKLQQVPVTFIYPIVIALMLIILLLPLVKFYVMGKDEHVRYADFALGVVSFFVGAAMLTLIIIQVLLLMAADIRAEANLKKICTQISGSFLKEITSAYLQLDKLDSLVVNQPDSVPATKFHTHANYDVSQIVKNYFVDSAPAENKICYNFNRVSWIDSNGDQHLKAEVGKDNPVFANVRDRKYFQQLLHNQGYPLPGYPDANIGLEAVNSWTNGGFAVLISLKSRFKSSSVASMSLQLPSVMETILPPGYGFCIMDEQGKVMMHADMHRNLQENFIEKSEPSRQVSEAIKSRQETRFSEINLYGKKNVLNIIPIEGMPFYLATFYDKGYIVPVNMRIFTFSLLFCFISFASCLLIWLFVFRRKYVRENFLYEPSFYFNWVVPKEKKINFYTLSFAYLVLYLAIHLLVIFSFAYFDISNYAVLLMVLVMPVNAFSGLYVVNYRIKKDENFYVPSAKSTRRTKALVALLFQPAVILTVWFFSRAKGYSVEPQFLYFGAVFFIVLCLLFFLPMGSFRLVYKMSGSYMTQYSRLATALILCTAAFPAGMYTWYAHNQEITQAVKKGQLYLAQALQKRAAYNHEFTADRQQLHLPQGYYDSLQFRAGIDTIYNDTVQYLDADSGKADSYEQFYFSIANQIGNNYYDPLLIPVLEDASADKSWQWTKNNKGSLNFLYRNFPTSGAQQSAKNIKISSVFPPRYVYATNSMGGWILKLFVLAFIYGLYLLVRYLSTRLFLRKYITYWQHNDNFLVVIKTTFAEFKIARLQRGNASGKLQVIDDNTFKNEVDDFMPLMDSDGIYEQEKNMTELLVKFKEFYFYIWDKCTPKEKYLLLDFAQHGFVNFKNTEVIHGLLKKGILMVQDQEVSLFSLSFRSFVLTQLHNEDTQRLQEQFKQEGTWQSIRIPLMVVMLGVAFFIFFTQEEAFQKISALVAGVGTVFSLVIKFFSDGTNVFSAKK